MVPEYANGQLLNSQAKAIFAEDQQIFNVLQGSLVCLDIAGAQIHKGKDKDKTQEHPQTLENPVEALLTYNAL